MFARFLLTFCQKTFDSGIQSKTRFFDVLIKDTTHFALKLNNPFTELMFGATDQTIRKKKSENTQKSRNNPIKAYCWTKFICPFSHMTNQQPFNLDMNNVQMPLLNTHLTLYYLPRKSLAVSTIFDIISRNRVFKRCSYSSNKQCNIDNCGYLVKKSTDTHFTKPIFIQLSNYVISYCFVCVISSVYGILYRERERERKSERET